MNKNKIIFAIIAVVLVWLITILVINLNSGRNNNVRTNSTWDFKIWILDDSETDFTNFVTWFKTANPSFATKNILVESFSDTQTYINTLTSAIASWNAPDIFMLNNSESWVLENQILWIDPTVISPNDFRLRFDPIFWSDLIITDETDSTVEFLKGVPAGYEALGIFYNRKYFLRPSDMRTWSDFAKEVKTISNKYSNIIPIALWNGAWVTRAVDAITSLIVLEGKDSLTTSDASQVRQVLAMYNAFGQRDGDNRYNILSAPFIRDIDIDFFTQWDVAAMIGYPRDLLAIDRIWYQKNFLFATPFPSYAGSEKKVSINYNYFAINKDSTHVNTALSFLSYLSSNQGQQAYIDAFPYYLSPEVDVATNMSEKKILPNYNIVYKNFVEQWDVLVSFDVWNKNLYDTGLKSILDLESWYDQKFNELSSYITCSSTKQKTFLNLSSPCR